MGNYQPTPADREKEYGVAPSSKPLMFNPGSPEFTNGDFGIQDTTTSSTEATSSEDLSTIEGEYAELFEETTVPMVFKWEGGGNNVYIAGTFNKWWEKIPMHGSGNDFTYIHDLHKGKHAYKFIVDDEWRFAPDQPTVSDTHGHINNFVDLSNFTATLRNDTTPLGAQDHLTRDEDFKEYIPNMDDYTNEPPSLPPHLRHIILNSSSRDPEKAEMDTPQHVTVDHLYCTALKKDGLMVLGVTERFRDKFVTTVYYSPEEPYIGLPNHRGQSR